MNPDTAILLVDDSESQRLSLTALVEDAGYRNVHAAESADAALSFLQSRLPASVGVVLMDLNMPGVDGIEACRRIKSTQGWEDTPVIMVTSSDETSDLRLAFDAGAMDYITKPPNEVELAARVQSALALKCEMDRRKKRELALARSERRLSTVLESAMDAILTLDAQHRITLFNRAAEEIFCARSSAALGAPLEEFIAAASRTVLHEWLRQNSAQSQRQLWAPEGLFGLRADGEEFPIEATLSPATVDDAHQFTLILRDMTLRDAASETLRDLQARHRGLQEVLQREQQIEGFIGSSAAMQPVFSAIAKVAAGDTTVLINGETGTGKELIARAIHAASPRRESPLVPVNCAALPGDLIESELFGHERGAFTGASGMRKGRFELADGGTIFLDEVGELSPKAQAKLLRALQEQQFERVGGTETIRVNVRVIAATNRDLKEMVAKGDFRADLYYRLNVFPILSPPLRERRSDVKPLAEFFLEKYSRKLGKPFTGLLPISLERLARYRWPGNVRELQNVIERAAILGRPPLLEVQDLLLGGEQPDANESEVVDDVMRSHIRRVLDEHGWVIEGVQGAAAALGMKPSTLRYRMKQLDIRRQGK